MEQLRVNEFTADQQRLYKDTCGDIHSVELLSPPVRIFKNLSEQLLQYLKKISAYCYLSKKTPDSFF